MTVLDISLILFGYLAGSVASAIISCKLLGLPDPRGVGSGNPGATNVLRVGGKRAAAITLFGDILKGVVPVLVASYLDAGTLTLAATAVAAFVGHLFPVFFGFKGGKGVATAFGAVTALSPLTGLAMLATWLSMAVVFRYSSLAALTAAALAPVYLWFFAAPLDYRYAVTAISVALIARHHTNIRNLLSGREGKIGQKD